MVWYLYSQSIEDLYTNKVKCVRKLCELSVALTHHVCLAKGFHWTLGPRFKFIPAEWVLNFPQGWVLNFFQGWVLNFIQGWDMKFSNPFVKKYNILKLIFIHYIVYHHQGNENCVSHHREILRWENVLSQAWEKKIPTLRKIRVPTLGQ